VTKQSVWLIGFFLIIYQRSIVLWLLGSLLALSSYGILLLVQQDIEAIAVCKERCFLTKIETKNCNLIIPYLPIVLKGAMHDTLYRVSGPFSIKYKNKLLPIIVLTSHKKPVFLSKINEHKFSLDHLWSQSSFVSQEFYRCFIKGLYPKSFWVDLIEKMNLLHVICFSGWHVVQIFLLLKGNFYLFTLLGLILMNILNCPFPYTRALSFYLLKPFVSNRFLIFQLSFLVGLCFNPFAWMSWSFWLTTYYAVLLEYKKITYWQLKFYGLGWAILFTEALYPVPIILGCVVELVIIYVLYPICWGSLFFEYVQPGIMNDFFEIMLYFFKVVEDQHYGFFYLPAYVGSFILVTPFIFLDSKKIR
jgi:hypothetical protein